LIGRENWATKLAGASPGRAGRLKMANAANSGRLGAPLSKGCHTQDAAPAGAAALAGSARTTREAIPTSGGSTLRTPSGCYFSDRCHTTPQPLCAQGSSLRQSGILLCVIPRPPRRGERPTPAQRFVWGAVIPLLLVVLIAGFVVIGSRASIVGTAVLIFVVWLAIRRWGRK
jgi:hypothetical protein